MTEWLPGTSADSKAARILLLLLLFGLPLWVGATSPLAKLSLVAGCFLLLLLVSHKHTKIYSPPGLIPFSFFCLWLLLQLIPLPPLLLEFLLPGYLERLEQGLWLLDPGVWHPLSLYPAATLNEFFRYSAYLAFYLAAANILISLKAQKRLLLWLAAFFGFYAFFGLAQFFSPTERIFWFFSPWPEAGRFFATYVNGNHYAALLGMVFPLLVICLLLNIPHAGYGGLRDRLNDIFTDIELNQAILLGLVTIIAAVSVFFSLSRSGTFCLFASSLVLLLLLVGREQLRGRMLIFLSVLVAAVGLLAFFGWDPLIERFAKTFNADGELQTQRLTYWLDSLNLFRAAPLTGSGAGTFIDTYPAVQTVITNGLVVDHAHNDYVELLTDLGLIGFLLVLWFWVQFLWSVLPAWRQRRNRTSRLICAGSFAGLCAIMLHSFTDFNLVIPANGIYFFLLFALLAVASHSSSGRRKERSLLPVFTPMSRKGIYAFSATFLVVALLVSGGTEFASARFDPMKTVDLSSAESGQLEKVKNVAKSAMSIAPLQPHYPFVSGLVMGQLADPSGSLAEYKKAIWRRPLHVEYQLQTARTLFVLNQPDRAEIILKNSLLMNPFNWLSAHELATFYFASGRVPEGLEVFKTALHLRTDKTSEVIRTLVIAGVKRPDFFDAIPQRSRSWAILGDFLRELEDFSAAERAYRRGFDALQTEDPPNINIVWRYLGLLQKQKRNAEALELLRVSLQTFPQNASILSRQGVLYEREGLRDRAIEAYRSTIMINPKADWVRKRLEKLQGH